MCRELTWGTLSRVEKYLNTHPTELLCFGGCVIYVIGECSTTGHINTEVFNMLSFGDNISIIVIVNSIVCYSTVFVNQIRHILKFNGIKGHVIIMAPFIH